MVVSPQVQQVPVLNQDTEAESCRFSMIAIIYISNSVVNDGYNHVDSCEAYKPRTDNYMMAVTNICNSYLTSSAPDPDACCKSAMISITNISNSVRNDNPSDSCEAYKQRIINFMNDILDYTSIIC